MPAFGAHDQHSGVEEGTVGGTAPGRRDVRTGRVVRDSDNSEKQKRKA